MFCVKNDELKPLVWELTEILYFSALFIFQHIPSDDDDVIVPTLYKVGMTGNFS